MCQEETTMSMGGCLPPYLGPKRHHSISPLLSDIVGWCCEGLDVWGTGRAGAALAAGLSCHVVVDDDTNLIVLVAAVQC
jgi:hypothetical protein